MEKELESRVRLEYAAMKANVSMEEFGKASEAAGAIRAFESILALPKKTVRENTAFFERVEDILRRVL